MPFDSRGASTPLFSIVVPTYNRATLVAQAIESILRQSNPDFEAIIVDDGSTDDTLVRLSRFTDPRLRIFSKENGERGAARNFGASKSMGEYINFLDSDDVLFPNHLSVAREVIDERDRPPIFHLGYEVWTSSREILGKPMVLGGPLNTSLFSRGNILSCNGVFLRRDIASAFPFNEDRILAGTEDYELWLRLAARIPILGIGVPTSAIINHASRSVLLSDESQLDGRMRTLIANVFADSAVTAQFGCFKSRVCADAESYIALHLALSGQRSAALKRMWKAIRLHPGQIATRRFGALIKHLLATRALP